MSKNLAAESSLSAATEVAEDFSLAVADWDVNMCKVWVRNAGLSPIVQVAFEAKHIDGVRLLSLDRSNIDELDISDLCIRRSLLESLNLLQALALEQDRRAALSVYASDYASFEKESKASAQSNGPNNDDVILEVLETVRFEITSASKASEAATKTWKSESCEMSELQASLAYALQLQQGFNVMHLHETYDHELAEALQAGRCPPRRNYDSVPIVQGTPHQAQQAGHVPEAHGEQHQAKQTGPLDQLAAQGAPHQAKLVTCTTPIGRCDCCYEKSLLVRGFNFSCGHQQCSGCVKTWLLSGIRDTSMLPPKCCGIDVDLSIVSLVLNKLQADELFKRCGEIKCTKKMHCAYPDCGAFINLEPLLKLESLPSDVLCPSCSRRSCTKCKSRSHFGAACNTNDNSTERSMLQALANDSGWKACPQCSVYIELIHGCNHIICHCRHEFCFQCSGPWGKNRCSNSCDLWEEHRLVENAEQRVRAMEAARDQPLEARAREIEVQRARRGLEAHEDCHHDWTRVEPRHRLPSHHCHNCGFTLYVYGFVCSSDCEQTVCHTCRFHRLRQQGWGR